MAENVTANRCILLNKSWFCDDQTMANRTINLVETTNDLSIVSKASMVERGYVDDPFVRYFVPKTKRRSPLINRGYYLRFQALRYALNEHCFDLLVSLGSGFDTLPFRNGLNAKLIEIDFIDVALNKAKVIVNNSLLSPITFVSLSCDEKQNARCVLRTEKYCLIGADLRDSKSICQLLVENELIFGEKFEKVGILNECSLCYIEEYYTNTLLKELLREFVDFEVIFISYEMMNSDADNDTFTDVMTSHFETIGSPLKTLLNRTESVDRMKKIGFTNVKIIDMLTFWSDFISSEEKNRVNKLEPFDEHEEFNLLCCNYAITIAKKQRNCVDCVNLETFDERFGLKTEEKFVTQSSVKYELSEKYLRRFGHCLYQTGTSELFIFGGFGYNETSEFKHQRLSDLLCFDLRTKNFEECKINGRLESRMHSQLVYLSEECMFLIGGRSSPVNRFGCTLLRRTSHLNFTVQSVNESNLPHCFRHRAVCVNNNSVVSVGGKGCPKDTFYIYDIIRNEWTAQNCLDLNRHSHSCSVFDANTILITGGLHIEDNGFIDTSCLLDLRSNRFPSLRNLPKIYSHTSHSDSVKLYIFGGISSLGSSNQLLVYDLRNESVVESIKIDSKHKVMLHNHCSAFLNNQLYSIGGGGNCFSFGTHINEYSLVINV